jgi:hypothetical protein
MRISTLTQAIIAKGEREDRPNGVQLYRTFMPAERYIVDFADDFSSGGWRQYDTNQDASYFGVWVNPDLLCGLTYVEGDWHLETCPSAEEYNAMIRRMNAFYDDGQVATVIDADDGSVTVYRQDRGAFLLPAGQ